MIKYLNIEKPKIRYSWAAKAHVQDELRPSMYQYYDTEQEAIDAAELAMRACYKRYLKIAFPIDLPSFDEIAEKYGYD